MTALGTPDAVVGAAAGTADETVDGLGGGAPSGPAGGVLAGTYPNPSFAVEMATQSELAARAAGSYPGVRRSGFYHDSLGVPGQTSAFTQGTVYVVPFWVPKAKTLDRIGIEVTTVAGSSVVRLGIYNDDGDGMAGTVLLDAGTIDSSSGTTFKEINISQALSPGLYWLASCSQGGAPTLRASSGQAGAGASIGIGSEAASNLASNVMVGYRGNTGVAGALPAFSSPAALNVAPRILVRVE